MKNTIPLHADEFEAIAEAVPGVVLVARDRGCRHVVGNSAACALFRVESGTNLSRWQPTTAPHFRLCQHGVELGPSDVPLQRAARGETLNNYELELHFDDGCVHYLQGHAMPLLDAYGNPRGAVAAYADMTERRRAEEALRASQERLRFTLEASRVGTWHWDIATGAVEWSGNLESIHEMPRGSFSSNFDAFLERVHPDHRERVIATIDQALSDGGEYRVEYREAATGGWIEGRGLVERNAAGEATGITGISMDVSERKRAEEAMRESQERLQFTLQSASIGTWRWDVASGEVEWSDNLEAIYQRPPGSFDRRFESFLDAVHPDDRKAVMEAIQGALAGDREYALEHRVQRPDGTDGWLECRGRVEYDAAGEPVRMTGICMDATERKQAEELLRALADAGTTLASSLDYDTALKQVADAVVPGWGDWCVIDVLDDGGALQTATLAHVDPEKTERARELRREYPPRLDAETGVGYVTRTSEAQCFPELTDADLQRIATDERHLDLLRELGLRSCVVVPLVARGRTLGTLMLITSEAHRRYRESDVPHVQELARRCAFAVDNARLYREAQRELSQRKETEDELKRLNETLEQRVAERTALAEKRAEQLRGLAGELAHAEQRERRRLAQTLHDDHQQVLIAAKLHLGILQQSAEPQHEDLAKLEDLLEDAVQSARTVSRELSPAVLYDAGLAAALRWLGPIKEEKYGLKVHVDADGAADPDAEDVSIFLYQAVRELLLNTVKHADTREAWLSMAPAPDDMVQIEVRDCGRGFDQGAIMEAQASGGQFGLFGMRERLALFNGTLEVDTVPNEGTRVTMLAPKRSSGGGDSGYVAQQRRAEQPGHAGAGHAIRVLLADDHKMLRDGLANLLKAESDIELVGQAEDGQRALALAQELQPDVIVMDISMPGINGIEATRRIREMLPAAAVVGLSMHDSAEMAQAMRDAGAATYLSKGGAATALVSAIRTHGAPHAGEC